MSHNAISTLSNLSTLSIVAKNQPATMEQLLRVVRFRGFQLDRIAMNPSSQIDKLEISLSVSSQRPIHLLENQLKKLVDIQQVFVEKTSTSRLQIN